MSSPNDKLDVLINHFFRSRFSFVSFGENVWHPPTDIYETNEGAFVKMELGGVERKDIQIILEGKRLIVQGIRRDPSEKGKISYHQLEINYGPFRSIFSLPFLVKAKEVKARYRDGFLEIEMPCCNMEPFEEIVVVEIE